VQVCMLYWKRGLRGAEFGTNRGGERCFRKFVRKFIEQTTRSTTGKEYDNFKDNVRETRRQGVEYIDEAPDMVKQQVPMTTVTHIHFP
jgi:hypothetical protein